MKKALVPVVIILIIAAVVGIAIMPSTPQATKKIEDDITAALGSGKTVFIQLSSSGCVTCRKMKPEVEKIMAEMQSSPDYYIVNIDVNSHKSLATKYTVTGVPTQVVLTPSGAEAYRNMGYMSYDNIKYVLSNTPGS
jgi:thioredoxin 1